MTLSRLLSPVIFDRCNKDDLVKVFSKSYVVMPVPYFLKDQFRCWVSAALLICSPVLGMIKILYLALAELKFGLLYTLIMLSGGLRAPTVQRPAFLSQVTLLDATQYRSGLN